MWVDQSGMFRPFTLSISTLQVLVCGLDAVWMRRRVNDVPDASLISMLVALRVASCLRVPPYRCIVEVSLQVLHRRMPLKVSLQCVSDTVER